MPIVGQHACVIKPLSAFQKGSIRMLKAKGGRTILIGRSHGKTKTTTHSIHYDMTQWDTDRARKDCEKKGGTFHKGATKGKKSSFSSEHFGTKQWFIKQEVQKGIAKSKK